MEKRGRSEEDDVEKESLPAKKLKVEEVSDVSLSSSQKNVSPGGSDKCNEISDLSIKGSSNAESQQLESNKDSDNNTQNHGAMVAKHYNAVPEVGLATRAQSRIIHMRNFHNWIKAQLIDEYLEKIRQGKSHNQSINVMDMCCGKGGDLFKWKKGNVSHVICVDIADVSVEQCRARYNDMNKKQNSFFSADFFVYDCTKVRLREKFKDPTIQLDLVSCQFAFHYCFESLPQAECMFKNASETLRPGGFFIGTIPNANELVSRWRKVEGNEFGNSIYKVIFKCDKKKPPLFGGEYDFLLEEVVNCPEFLVYKKLFIKLALKFGLKLIIFEPFAEFYERMKSDGKTLLSRTDALETYPPFHDTPLRGDPDKDYKHAIEYMQNSTGHRKIGTLSQSEWEVSSLYAVFAFKKLKSVWNAEGKPEYIMED